MPDLNIPPPEVQEVPRKLRRLRRATPHSVAFAVAGCTCIVLAAIALPILEIPGIAKVTWLERDNGDGEILLCAAGVGLVSALLGWKAFLNLAGLTALLVPGNFVIQLHRVGKIFEPLEEVDSGGFFSSITKIQPAVLVCFIGGLLLLFAASAVRSQTLIR